MNLKFEQNFSMDELMERNRHPHMGQTEPAQTTPLTPAEPQVQEHHVVVNWTMPESMERIENRLKTLEEQNTWQTEYLRRISERPTAYATHAQMDELLKAVKHLEQMTEQAGKLKEKSSSRRRIRLPRMHLSLPEWDWPTVVTVVMALAMAVLLLLWFKSGGDWSSLSLLRR